MGSSILELNEKGFSLIELVIVLAIVVILGSSLTPLFTHNSHTTKRVVCSQNRVSAQFEYEVYLFEIDKGHNHQIFNVYFTDKLDKICPSGGEITMSDNKLKCSIHDDVHKDDDVPYL